MAMTVKVGVRIRPFNKRQKQLQSKLCVDMNANTTILLQQQNQNKKEPEKRFTYDYSFWSFDGFQEQPNGYLNPVNEKYSDQKKVFSTMGKAILDNAWLGYHCCLFAYGQTGSGKSYSMVGYGQNKGIVKISCQQIFKRIKENKQPNKKYEVQVSMLQIYNQVIQDLLVSIQKRPTKGLMIRQNNLLGIYVQGIQKHFVTNYEQIENLMEKGSANRTVAATKMNATSSRAHTIISIDFKSIEIIEGKQVAKISVINLVDLAGSQRQSKTQATGQRLKQAIGINQSLTTLGQVISALADLSEGKKVFVPYRNSSLTRILQNALGGNSQTVMICAISPATDNYQQTLSTLRYADQAKKIKNKPVVNESQTDKMIRELKEENERLKKLLKQKGISGNIYQLDQKLNDQVKKQVQQKDDEDTSNDEIKDAQKQRDEIISKITELEKSPQQKILQEQKKNEDFMNIILEKLKRQVNQQGNKKMKQQDSSTISRALLKKMKKDLGDEMEKYPYLQNINKDFYLNRKLKIYLKKDVTTVGKFRFNKKIIQQQHDIVVSGNDVKAFHCSIIKDNQGNIFVQPVSLKCLIYINGMKIKKQQKLYHCDRIIFGINSAFLFKSKKHKQFRDGKEIKGKDVDWDFLRKQMKNVDIDASDTEEINDACCSIL